MFEFISFSNALVSLVINYIVKIQWFQTKYQRLSIEIIKSPKCFIILPLVVSFFINYNFNYETIHNRSQFHVVQNFDYEVRQVVITNNQDLSIPHFLTKCLDIQHELLSNLSSYDIYLQSPLEIWGNDIDILQEDENIWKSFHINKEFHSSLGGVEKVNGIIKHFDMLRILIIHKKEESINPIWSKVISNFNESNSSAQIVSIDVQKFPILNILSIFIYLSTFIYFILKLSHTFQIRSKAGLLLAVTVQIGLSITSTISIMNWFDKFDVDLYYPLIIVLVSFQKKLKIIEQLSLLPNEMSIQLKFSKLLQNYGIESTLITVNFLVGLLTISKLSSNLHAICLFTSLGLLLDHILYLTFFMSILIIDTLRVELDDLINNQDEGRKKVPRIPKLFTYSIVLVFLITIALSGTNDLTIDIFTTKTLKIFNHTNILIHPAFFNDTITNFNSSIAYTYDGYYVLEFLLIFLFSFSIIAIILGYYTPVINENSETIVEKSNSFNVKLLTDGHFLDVIKIATSKSPYIVSLGLDHRVLVWSPISKPTPAPTQLPITPNLWPITVVKLSDCGTFIVVFSKKGLIQCWSRQTKTWIWKHEIEELKNNNPLESFFRKKTIPAFLQRKAISKPPGSRRDSIRSFMTIDNSDVDSSLHEFVIVLKDATIILVDNKGLTRCQLVKNETMVSCSKLLTPRISDRLISLTKSGKILVSMSVNNKWKTRSLNIIQNTFYINSDQHSESDFSNCQISIIEFVGFLIRTFSTYAELIDVQTGILIKRFEISPFKKGTFKVFHSQPTHCRFCGSASFSSLSVAYTPLNSKSVVMHTFTVDHRAKTSICLRVERDAREIRCVGLNSVVENIYEKDDIEGWSITDNNQIIGISKNHEEEFSLSTPVSSAILRNRFDKSIKKPESHHNFWKGWTMNSDGHIDNYLIPETINSKELLINSISVITKFGHKSIVVAFGNIMKLLYLGNDELIFNDVVHSLGFANKRRLLQRNEKIFNEF
ncbi:hypothetical protein WICMUC_000312 [Wickerhamomyces mucosus]|uniref:Sterol regulatory element-binding protein cleavage-activating protein n=1 Tax=Wickerhamomyces mucosus TaxID=1378264 RepID=A0A9P8PZL1_9ASCO|nr:hypothetical protein WICMUC_000312 [Wickerhamomyces mucosus]